MRKSRSPLAPVAIVTGCDKPQGIGFAIAHALATDGYHLLVTQQDAPGRNAATAKLIAEGLQPASKPADREVRVLSVDLALPHSVETIMEAARQHFGRVDVLVNNAAYGVNATIDDLSADLIDHHLAVNVRAPMLLAQAFVAHWQGKDGGRIVNLTSGQSLHAMPDNLPYATSKGALEAFTQSLARAVIGRGITVNAIDPGPTDTGWMTDEIRAELTAHAPAGRLSTPQDTARLVRWLCSEEGGWVTGQIIHSRGGF